MRENTIHLNKISTKKNYKPSIHKPIIYNPNETPAKLEICLKHQKATSVGSYMEDPLVMPLQFSSDFSKRTTVHDLCPCCGMRTNTEKIN